MENTVRRHSSAILTLGALGAVLFAVLTVLPGVGQCPSTCFYYDSEGNRITYACLICTENDTNPCTANTWNVPAGGACVIEDQPLVDNGTACDDGSTSGVCMGGVCTAVDCDSVAATATQACVSDVNAAWQACYANTGGPCADTDPAIVAALATLDASVLAACNDGEFGSLTAAALSDRLSVACASEAASLSSRAYGGPLGVAHSNADTSGQTCLGVAQQSASTLIDAALGATHACLESGSCDPATLATDIQTLATTAETDIAASCTALESLVALTPQQFVAKARHQVDCLVATSRTDTAPLSLSCGPDRVGSIPTRGQYVQIVLDSAVWGTRCGDGSPYAFQVRLAPAGQPLDRVLIGMQGGGVCIFGNDCIPLWQNAPGLFEALSDQAPTSGVMSNSTSQNDFANWTKVYLPYCTQDVFAGGGIAQPFDGFSIERYGSVNARAAVEYVRNLIWLMMDQEPGAGYRPDQITAAFGGWSAGGFGTLYNYHWVLDDLQWPHTTAFADSSLALDSGDVLFSVRVLGGLLQALWAALPVFPPYCIAGDCAVGPDLYTATAPRLKAVPNQQMLILSNQRDNTQINTTFFPSTPAWINEARTTTCDTKDLNGIHYYFTSQTNSVHVVSLGSLYQGSVDGEAMSDWMFGAVSGAPNAVVDRIEEGNFVSQIGGVNPFPCSVAP